MEEEKRKGAGDRRGRRRWGRRKASRWLQTRPCPTPPTWTPKCSPCSTCPPCSTRRTRVGCSWRFAASSSVRSARDQIASASLLTHHPTWKCRTAGWPPATIVLRWAFSLMWHFLTESQEVLGVKCLVVCQFTLMVDQCGRWESQLEIYQSVFSKKSGSYFFDDKGHL